MTKKFKWTVIAVFILCCAMLLAVAFVINVKTSRDSRALLEESLRSQLLSIASAARGIIDPAHLNNWNSNDDIEDDPVYAETLHALRTLANNVGADYIYVLKQYDGVCYFVLDTDTEDTEVFIPYDAKEVHLSAFLGRERAGVLNVIDEYGTFNTAAVPIYFNGKVIAVVSADIEDHLFTENAENAKMNTVLLVLVLLLMIAVISLLMIKLLRRVQVMTDRLEHIAMHDKLTNLPNREYLLSHLTKITDAKKGEQPFALIFVDVDNFKAVNDSAGHDAGDELLMSIADYLQNAPGQSKAFRPAAGKLNVAARIGGDEFLLVVDGLEDDAGIERFCADLVGNFRERIDMHHIEKYDVGLSVGASRYPRDSRDHNVLIKYADIAMYHAKKHGKNGYMIYCDELAPKDQK